MSFTEAIKSCLRNYVTFSGRAPRSEYWFFALFTALVYTILPFLEAAIYGMPVLTMVLALGLILPSLAVTIRRLHDTGRSGWWILVTLIPLVGSIIFLIWMFTKSQPTENAFGANPLPMAA